MTPSKLPSPFTSNGTTTTVLTETEYFIIERVDIQAGSAFPIVTGEQPQVWMALAGRGEIEAPPNSSLVLQPGVTALIPAAADGWKAGFSSDSRVLIVLLPSPLRNMLARFR
jgi:mannose-6-phosphate isomerase class I